MPALRPPRHALHTPRSHPSFRHAALLAVAASFLLIAAFAITGTGFSPQVAKANHVNRADAPTPSASITDTPTTAPTATPATPPSIQLLSPTSGQGPVGAHLTIKGTNFAAGANVAVFASSASDCSQQVAGLAAATANGSGSFTAKFLWPISLNGGTFFICAAGISSGAANYQVISPTAPTLSLSAPSIAVGQSLTINGSGFVGLADNSQVVLAAKDSTGHVTTISSAIVGADGTFSTPWVVNSTAGTVTIQAASHQEGNADPVLQATAQVAVTAATSPTASPSVSPTVASGGTSSANNQQSGGSGFVLVLVLVIVVILLAGLGVAAFFLLRRRNEPPDTLYGNGGYGPGEYPGFASRNRETLKVPQIGQTDRHAETGQFGNSGANGPRIGGVAQWDDPDPAPGPNWQPRPMSGRPREYDPQNYGGALTNPDSGATSGADPYPSLGYPPLDPWASQGGAPPGRQSPPQRPSGDSGPGTPQGRRPSQNSNRDWWGNTTNPASDDQ